MTPDGYHEAWLAGSFLLPLLAGRYLRPWLRRAPAPARAALEAACALIQAAIAAAGFATGSWILATIALVFAAGYGYLLHEVLAGRRGPA